MGLFHVGFLFVPQKGLPFPNCTLNAKGITNHSKSIKFHTKVSPTWWLPHACGPILAHLLTLRRQKGTQCTKEHLRVNGTPSVSIWWVWFHFATKALDNGIIEMVKTLLILELTANPLRVTSHTRPRARDHDTSSTLIGGKGGAGVSSLHTLCLSDQLSMWMQRGCKV
jgi:hypothetical protein